ncbi:MAG: uridine diphosphate-N-acetylglucosamine-binding protein YvcK [Propionibacteriales bacterium]|nr:uridine diphosphate-N-acetylglucosamine-binding protein YvcK [Propionibacteriales bacterium]
MVAPSTERVVALGGGHGLAASLGALRRVVEDLTAVVTVADNGGSSGRLRRELGVLPPGDLRQALAALCGDDDWGRTWARVLQHRFASSGELHNHAVGNLLIVALWELLQDDGGPAAGLEWVARLLGAQGRVLPMSEVPLDITAQVIGLDPADPQRVEEVRGQVEVARTAGQVVGVSIDPEDAAASPAAVAAIKDASWVVLGPGSWFTSVIPHLLVRDLGQALRTTPARRLLTLNLAPQPGETEGFSPDNHLEVLAAHAPDFEVDVVLADSRSVSDVHGLRTTAHHLGAELVVADVCVDDGSPRHDAERLAAAYASIFESTARPRD